MACRAQGGHAILNVELAVDASGSNGLRRRTKSVPDRPGKFISTRTISGVKARMPGSASSADTKAPTSSSIGEDFNIPTRAAV